MNSFLRDLGKETIIGIIFALLAFIATAIYSFVSKNETKVLLKYSLIIIVLSLLFVLGMFIYFKYFKFSKKNVFIISSSFASASFFSELIKSLIYKVEGLGFTPVLKLPQDDFSQTEVERYIKLIEKNISDYRAGIIILSDPVKQSQLFLDFAKKFKKPLIFLDSRKSEQYSLFSDNCCFIGFDNNKTGNLAASEVKTILKNNSSPNILVISSKQQSTRQEEFVKSINRIFSNANIIEDDTGSFNRRKSYMITLKKLKNIVANNDMPYDVIFLY